MPTTGIIAPVLAMILLVGIPSVTRAAPPVTLELVTERQLPLGEDRRWIEMLKDTGFTTIRIRSARGSDQVQVTERGGGDRASYHVVGVIKDSGRLVLPHARPFRLDDREALRKWLEKLRAGGGDRLSKPTGAFGITGEQLVQAHESLGQPIGFATKGKPTAEVVKRIAGDLPFEVQFSDDAARRLDRADEPIRDELRSLSGGTALAAALRPLGLVFGPRSGDGDGMRLVVTDSRQAEASWPVGWPPRQPPTGAMPRLFEFLPVEIQDFSLDQALDAVGGRLDAPMLFDHNSMARHQIDPAKVKVSLPKMRTYYRRIIDRLLAQGQLKCEIRTDEAGTAFLWISTVKK